MSKKGISKIGGALFGSPEKSSSSSTNLAYGDISKAMSPAMGYTKTGGDLMSAMLGGGGGQAQQDAITNYSNSGGMQFLKDQGAQAITSNKAASGLLGSGSFGTELTKFNNGLASTYLDHYMSQANDLAKTGIGAAGVMSDAGRVQQSSSKGKKKGLLGGLAKGIAAVAPMAAMSDIRLKTDVEKIGEDADGLGRYSWTYKEGYGLPEGRHEGVMAHEVMVLRPEAYVPNFKGRYAGVDYSKLGN